MAEKFALELQTAPVRKPVDPAKPKRERTRWADWTDWGELVAAVEHALPGAYQAAKRRAAGASNAAATAAMLAEAKEAHARRVR